MLYEIGLNCSQYIRRLSDFELNAVSEALLGKNSEQIRLSIFDLALGNKPRGDAFIMSELARLGWVVNGKFTELGGLLKDPLREFSFWLERNKHLPSELEVPVLNRERFRGKRVLELGSGGGCNLFSLSGIASKLSGVEPMPVYVQLCSILTKMADLPEQDVIEASAENIPIPDGSYDVAICYSSHQYMDINRAMDEMARVLAPGGELIIVGNSLGPFLMETCKGMVTNDGLGRVKFNMVALFNTLYYQINGKRLIQDKITTGTTTTPIYPSRQYMLRQLKRVNLLWDNEKTCMVDSGETVLVATKPKSS